MKSLEDFKTTLTEDKSEYVKFDMLVRAGLANKAQITRIHKILDKMKEERPVFNPTERAILQNIFNKMVDLISNNKQIFQQTRRAVREETEEELQEAVIDTSDYKVGPSGKKVRAHRIHVGKEAPKVGDVPEPEVTKEEFEELQENRVDLKTPPFVLVLRRKAIRMYPEGTRVALYYNQSLNRYFSVPDSARNLDRNPIAAEQYVAEEFLEESVMDTLHKIVKEKQSMPVKFDSGHTRKVDHFTASAITKVHGALNDENKKKFSDMVHKSPEHFSKASEFALKKVK
jgi:hypothetical protein